MVDWSLAAQIARLASGSRTGPAPAADLAARARELEPHVAEHTRLALESPAPAAEILSRAEWAELNLGTLAELLDPVATRLDQRLEFAGPLAGALQAGAGATLAAEAGLVVGYVSQRVLGQYELSLLQPEAEPRLVLVGPNLARAARDLDVDPDSFYGWVVIHELTHVFQFQGVSWLRPHMSALVREYLDTVEVRIQRGAAGALPSLPAMSKLVEAFREGGLAALVQTREQQRLMDRLQTTMAVIEGYSEHVMDALGVELLPAYEGLRAAMERRRRSRSAPERVLERLLGFDLKLRQYERGKRFCDAVADSGGIDALNRVWESPDALPSPHELTRPDAWLARMASSAPAAA
jgi:coenzyme F420 biosynthesis associated uncharacterized protein